MVRRFDPDRTIPRRVVERCVYAGLRAPSAGFSQGWDFVVLDGPDARGRFWGACEGVDDGPGDPSPRRTEEPDAWLRGVSAAPVLVLCLSDPERYLDRYAAPDKGWADRDLGRWPIPYWDVDTGMAALLMLLSAADQGIGGLFFGVPAEAHDAVRRAHGIPGSRRIVGVVALGYERERVGGSSRARPRRPAAEVVHWGRFGESVEGAG